MLYLQTDFQSSLPKSWGKELFKLYMLPGENRGLVGQSLICFQTTISLEKKNSSYSLTNISYQAMKFLYLRWNFKYTGSLLINRTRPMSTYVQRINNRMTNET